METKYYNIIYNYRLTQTSKAIIYCFLDLNTLIKKPINREMITELKFLNKIQNKIIQNKKINKKEMDTLIDIYLLRTFQFKKICKDNENLKLDIYNQLIKLCSIYYYLKEDYRFHVEYLQIQECYLKDFVYILYYIKQVSLLLQSKKDTNKDNLNQIQKEAKIIINDYYNELLYPVSVEYKKYKKYVKDKNEKFLSNYYNNQLL